MDGHSIQEEPLGTTNIALLGRKHRCIVRCKAKENPYNFLGMADEVISQAPDYVQAYWNEHGFILSHRGAVKRPIINQMRSLMAHGAGASGFSKSLMEMYRNTYMNRRKMWHAFSDCRYHDPGALSTRMQRAIFPKFDDPEYDVKVPSTTFLTSLCIKEIERRIPYYKRKLEMVSGKALSGDHSHKIAKVILIEGKRGFQGLYTLMNEFGKIVGFWLVNSTNMREVEERLQDIERRYRQHGFSGPFMFTADMCCPTRGFLAGTNNNKKMPVFPTLVGGPQNSTTQEDASTTPVADNDSTAESAQQQNSAIQEDASTMPTAKNRTAESAEHQNSAIQEDASTMLTINNSTAESAQQENSAIQEDASTMPTPDNSTAECAQRENSAIQEDASTMLTIKNSTAKSAQRENSAIQEDASTMLTINNSTAESAQQENSTIQEDASTMPTPDNSTAESVQQRALECNATNDSATLPSLESSVPSLSSLEIVQKQLTLPSSPIESQTMATAQMTAGTIARNVKEQGNVLFVDLEWTPRTEEGPGTVGIGLSDGSVYLFHIPTLGGIPSGVKTLMEEPTIKKVGNRFHNDVRKFKEANIKLQNPVELGKMARQRGIFSRADSGLESQVLKLLDCTLPKDKAVRCSTWNKKDKPTKKQVEYAALDVYATRSVYLTLVAMPWVNPFETPSPERDELRPGLNVLVYAKKCSHLVAHGQVISETPNDAFDQLRERKMVQIRIHHKDVIAPIAKPFVTEHGNTLGELFHMIHPNLLIMWTHHGNGNCYVSCQKL